MPYASGIADERLRAAPMRAAQLRALAHPLRLQLLHLLHAEGPATATQLAHRLGESTGSTSYHLRALHRAGMLEEEPRKGRERWWRRISGGPMIPNSISPQASASERRELQAAHAELEGMLVDRDEKALQRWTEIRYDLPLEWQDTQWIGNFQIWGSVAEIRDFVATVLELAEPLSKPPDDADPAPPELHFTFRVLPQEPVR
jgi:DNA-binding transcriptional ArsR family regulator